MYTRLSTGNTRKIEVSKLPYTSAALHRLGLAVIGMLAFLTTDLTADPIFVDPDRAANEDPDFLIQGEYAADGWGAQVIARGNGTFEAFLLDGGLPGAGWTGGARQRFEGQRQGESTVLTGHGLDLRIEDGVLSVRQADGKMKARLPRVERVSSTMGLEPPADAVILFAGPEDVEQWRNGRVDERGLLQQGVTSRRAFQDHRIHVEFLIPYRPEALGQARGNSGIYVQSRYEVQMLDSFGDEPDHSHNGGIYSVAEPTLNVSYPPLRWQTYDIHFRAARFDDDGNKTGNARMTVYHNGIKIHDDVEVPHTTTASPINQESDRPGPINLQDHGNPVHYRNVWVVEDITPEDL